MTSKPKPLPRRQQELYDLLKGKGDVPILSLYAALCPPGRDEVSQRDAQQHLGSLITRANRRLAKRGLRIQPGFLKGTYRLEVVE